MEIGPLVALGGVAALVLVVGCGLLALVLSGRRRIRRALAASRADVEALRARLDEIEAARAVAATLPVVPPTEYLITTAGAPAPEPGRVPNRVVLSATFGEPLVKAVAFGYGVRRALSPQSRNRIVFEMRREVRRARKQRRRETKRAARDAATRSTDREAA